MTEIKVEIVYTGEKLGVTPEQAEGTIFCEGVDRKSMLSLVKVSGKYNRTYKIVTQLVTLRPWRIVLDGDTLIVIGYYKIGIIDLALDALVQTVEFESDAGIVGIYPLGDGFFIHADDSVGFLTRQWNIAWIKYGPDLLFNTKVPCNPGVYDDYVVVWGWLGDKHYYNEHGEFKCEYYPDLKMSND